jgi:hypothetical protein
MLRRLRQADTENGEDLPGAIVQFAGDMAALLVLSLQQTTGEISKLFRLLYDLAGPSAHFRIQRLGQSPVLFFGALELGNINSGGVKE